MSQVDSGDGGAATAATIHAPYASVAVDTAGDLYITDSNAKAIRRVGPDGIISRFVDSPSFVARSFPMGLAFDQAGDLYVADPGQLATPFIWKVDPSGSVSPVAGKGVFGSSGNEGRALDAADPGRSDRRRTRWRPVLRRHERIPDGRYGRHHPRLRRHRCGRVLRGRGHGGRRMPSERARRCWLGVAADGAGNVYLGDPSNFRIRKVDPAGIITTVAGTGVEGYSGDGGPAVDATISSIAGLAVDAAGDLYFADAGNDVVRRIDTTGVITTVAGTGQAGFSGDCGPAVSAQLDQPSTVAIHDGILYIVDAGNERVRMVVP